VVCDGDLIVELDGTGNVVEIESGVIGIGSGGPFAACGTRVLLEFEGFSAEKIARRSMKIAAEKGVFINDTFVVKKVKWE